MRQHDVQLTAERCASDALDDHRQSGTLLSNTDELNDAGNQASGYQSVVANTEAYHRLVLVEIRLQLKRLIVQTRLAFVQFVRGTTCLVVRTHTHFITEREFSFLAVKVPRTNLDTRLQPSLNGLGLAHKHDAQRFLRRKPHF